MVIPAQTFSLLDIPLIFLIFFLEALLASDNAAALSMVVKKLPQEKRKKALFTGLFSAVFLRALGIIFTAYLIHLFLAQILGGAYLIYLAWKYLINPKQEKDTFSPTSYWKAVLYIELLDTLFAIDSILGAFALAALYYPFDIVSSKLWVIYLGGVLGVFAIRFVTTKLIELLEKHKYLERSVFLIIGWMGIKLLTEGFLHFSSNGTIRHYFDIFFGVGTLLILLFAIIKFCRRD